MTAIPVNPEILVWARSLRCLSLEEAADRLNIEPTVLEKLEAGETQPSLSLFEDIAAKYRLPQATLFSKNSPRAPTLPNDYRTVGGHSPQHSFEFSVAYSAVDNLRRILSIISEEDAEAVDASLPTYDKKLDPEFVAASERERLGIRSNYPIDWASHEAFNRWRAIIESQGIPVFLQKFPIDDCRGFTINNDNGRPIIVINKSEEFRSARIFTLIHEYCHLLIGEPGLSDLEGSNSVEAYCNKFAAAFLMPQDTLRLLIKQWPNSPVEWPDKDIIRWASRLKVSRIALALRLESLGLAPKGFSQRYNWYSGYTPRNTSSSGGDPIATTLSELGSTFTSAIFQAYERGVISRSSAAEYLGVGSDHFDRVGSYVEKHRGLAIVE